MENVKFSEASKRVGWALRRRCPNCGAGKIWRHWIATYESCPRCGIRFDRGEKDYFIGAYLVNLIVAELGFAVIFIATLIATWPNPPWTLVTIGSAILVVLAPLFTFPFTRGTWLAIDLLFRPEKPGEAA